MNDVDVTILAKEQIVVVEAIENIIEVAVPGPQGPAGPQGDPGPPGHSGASSWADITNKPSTLSGYGITDAATAVQGAKADSALQSGASSDLIAEGSSHLFFSAPRVLSAVLAGLSTATNAAIAASDTVLSAFGKLQAQITALASSVASKEPAISSGTTTQYWRGDKTWQTLNKAAVGLGNVDNTADTAKPVSTAQQAAINLKVDLASVGSANGVASLDSGGKVPAAQLPSYVDDVLEFANLAGFPAPGETGKIYIALDTSRQYRWSGSAYVQLVASPGTTDNVVEGTTNLYFTTGRVLATALSGLSTVTNAVISASDSVLSAFGKLQAQISGLASSKLDANATAAAATKLATARTINGVSFDGTANITVADSTKEPTIAAGTTAQYWRGDKSWQDLATSVRAVVLTGLSTATSTAVAATDTILVGIGKLQAQITSLTSTVSGKLDATATAVAATKLATARNINGAAFDGTADITIADSTKEPTISAGTTSQFWRGDKSWQDFATTVRAAVLTGLSTATNSAIVATDSVLVALGKLQAQVSSLVTGKLDVSATAAAATKLATARTINGVAFDGTANITVSDSTKEPTITAGTTAQFWRGDKRWQDFGTVTRAIALTGLSTATNAAITATDSILVGLGKLQAQISGLAANLAPSPTAGTKGYVATVNPSGNGYIVKRPIEGLDPETFGAAGTGTGDDLTALTAVQSNAGYGKPIALRGDYLVSSYSNPYGNIWKGTGRILTAVTGGYWQRNTYADIQRLHIGHEYLNRCFQYMRLGQGSASGTMKIVMFGDSTVQGGYGEDQKADQALSNALINRGIPNHVIYNQGVSGTKWGDLSALSFLSNANAMFVIKYGINDAGYGLAQLASDMDAKLSAIRGAAHGGLNELAILLVGPNATSDSPNSRDERWYEQIRGIYVAMARKYNCAYFDTYAHFQDARPASTLWLDNSYGDLRGIHPIQAFNARIWGAIADEFFGLGAIAPFQANAVSNEGAVSTSLTAATLPANFNYVMRLNRAPTSSGWPIDGFVRTCKNIDGGILQEIWSYGAGVTRKLSRTANLAGNSWNRWTGVGEAISLSNGWVAYGAPWKGPTATLTEEGIVVVEGLVKGGTTTAGTAIGTLPSGMWPTAMLLFNCMANGANVKIQIDTSGVISAFSTADGTFTSLSGITFLAA